MRGVTKVLELFCVVCCDPFKVLLNKLIFVMVELVDQGDETHDQYSSLTIVMRNAEGLSVIEGIILQDSGYPDSCSEANQSLMAV